MPHNKFKIYQTPEQQSSAYQDDVLKDMFNIDDESQTNNNQVNKENSNGIDVDEALALIEQDLHKRGFYMFKRYSLLKGTVSQLQISDQDSDNIGLITMIVVLITGAFELIFSLFTFFKLCSINLEGKKFSYYVGRKFVEGKLTHIRFRNGDYVEMVVEESDDNQYQSYAVRIPKAHALYFPHAVDITTLPRLKCSALIAGAFSFFNYLLIILFVFLDGSYGDLLNKLVSYVSISFIGFFVLTIMFFLLMGGRYSFIGNRIFATLGYPKPWSHDTLAEHLRFEKLNRLGDPELYNDPQTPEFDRYNIHDRNATYYCRTPIIPDWVEVIDERGFTPDMDNQPPKLNQTEQ